jgi:hypothetical protein
MNEMQFVSRRSVDSFSHARKSMKSIFVLIVQENTILIDKKHSSRILLNDEVDINVISYRYAEILDMMLIVNDLSKSSHVKEKFMHCYDVYLMKSRLFDN